MTERPIHIDENGVAAPMDDAMFAAWQAEQASAAPPTAPDGPTLGDWRVGLLLWGRLDAVMAAVASAVKSTNPIAQAAGLIAQERLEYSNNVLRVELLQLGPALGFTDEEVDESLWRASRVAIGDLSGQWPVVA